MKIKILKRIGHLHLNHTLCQTHVEIKQSGFKLFLQRHMMQNEHTTNVLTHHPERKVGQMEDVVRKWN